jgi:hypothetical protein
MLKTLATVFRNLFPLQDKVRNESPETEDSEQAKSITQYYDADPLLRK